MVPKRFKEARIAAGLSQEKLADLLDIDGVNTRSRLSSYEVGRTEPPFSLVKRIAKILDYPENYFYTEDDNFAKAVLEFHRNRLKADFNPYYTVLVDVKDKIEQLNAYMGKVID
ncbi:helix-turn-helix transcriptional regulator [Erwinia papayae]|uniref:Helix-turn-helix transcriptional regulator n=1 Tax=Erwinia papayae TaxID=206499 RepID=A0ABV3N7I2_9GAMM|nr:helix-turn-helix transcriptional regulator [Hafnia paralvei]EKC9670358.1 helix-turn-helix transcriptional regulator [Escherichia coli]HEB0918937.1 helix-turn-helix transcriptional regulator [Enterobacter cloacae]TBL98033.1 XRE family transcriptional regulator [Hafnia paralvei]HEB0923974.1 helix-turn-helix transcriptional regulator [Enterobacter cloacae]HEB0928874.1 helix-turn-helix transcriptional regulator [Enterobacter cloacae]